MECSPCRVIFLGWLPPVRLECFRSDVVRSTGSDWSLELGRPGQKETDRLYVVIMFTHDDKQSFFSCLPLIKLIIQKYVNMQMVKQKKKLKHAHD